MPQSFSDGHRVVWLSPSPSAERAVGMIAEAVGEQAVIAAKGLEVWACDVRTGYSMRSEIEGAARLARAKGWDSFHLVGFSAGATVALALALERPDAVKTLCLIEPAYIGDDDWSPDEAAYRAAISESYSLPADAHRAAFRKAVMHPDEPALPPAPPTSRDSFERSVMLEWRALRDCGFASTDLVALSQPLLIVSGGRSHPRFAGLADRLCELMPGVEVAVFPEHHHFSPPQRNEPERVAELLLDLWSRGPT